MIPVAVFLTGLGGFIAGMAVAHQMGPRRCPHLRVRCVHGDEINLLRGSRRVCLECGTVLDGPLPEPCSVTGQPHHEPA